MDSYTDESNSKKKMLIPLVVLMLCAVSLVGAGYAAVQTSTVTNGNGVGYDTFTISLKGEDSNEVTGTWFNSVSVVDFGAVKTSPPDVASYNVALCKETVATGNVVVEKTGAGSHDNAKLTVVVTAAGLSEDISNIIKVKVSVKDVAKEISSNTTSFDPIVVDYGDPVDVKVTVELAPGMSSATKAEFDAFKAAIGSLSFGFKFSAECE